MIRPAMMASRPFNWILRAVSRARATDKPVKSAMEMPFTFTARLSGRRRFPPHAVGAVEGTRSRLQLRDVDPAIGTRQARGIQLLFSADDRYLHQAAC